jgi:hypothetical protein
MRQLTAAAWVLAEGQNPILPRSSELAMALVGLVFLLVPVLIVGFVIWQVVRTRRAAERAADAAEAMARGARVEDD